MNFILLKNMNIISSIVSKYIYHVFLFHVLNTFTVLLRNSFSKIHTFNSCFKKVFAACMRNFFPFAMLLYHVFLYTLLYITFTYKYVNTRLEMIFLMSLYVSTTVFCSFWNIREKTQIVAISFSKSSYALCLENWDYISFVYFWNLIYLKI